MASHDPVAVVSAEYCSPYPVDVAVERKGPSGSFVVKDINGAIMFKVKFKGWTGDRRVFLDAIGNPILTLRKKTKLFGWRRWEAFRGDSKDSNDFLFSLKESSMFQLKTKLDVFLANNTSEEVCDFKMKANWLETSCVIYEGDSSAIAAQMKKKSVFLGRTKFMVTVYPNMDCAFIVALIVIYDAINHENQDSSSSPMNMTTTNAIM